MGSEAPVLTVELLKSMATPVDWLRGLGYARNGRVIGLEADPEAGVLLASEPPRVPLKKSPLDLSHHQVHILLHWHPLIEQVRVIPRLVWMDKKGRNILRTHPLTPEPAQNHMIR